MVTGCNKEDLETTKNGNLATQSQNLLTWEEIQSLNYKYKKNFEIPVEDVQKEIDQLLSQEVISQQSDGRVAQVLSVSKVEKLRMKAKTGTQSNDSGGRTDDDGKDSVSLYLFNFTDGKGDEVGYALASGDDRFPGVLAFSPTGGSLHYGDSIENPGMAIFLSGVQNYINTEIEWQQHLSDSLSGIAMTKVYENLPQKTLDSLKNLEPNGSNGRISEIDNYGFVTKIRYEYGNYEDVEKKIDEFVDFYWDQRLFYNDVLERVKGCDAPMGCVTIATGMILAYYKKPQIKNNFYFSPEKWDLISNKRKKAGERDYTPAERTAISNMLFYIGNCDYLKIDYDCEASGGKDENAYNTFDKLGYHAYKTEYNFDKVKSSIKNKRPVYVSGCSQLCGFIWNWGCGSCHAWVIDGYWNRKRKVTAMVDVYGQGGITKIYSYPSGSYYEYNEVIYCNYGWGSYNNGWVTSKVFMTPKHNYYYDLNILHDIHPKKYTTPTQPDIQGSN